MNKVILRGYVGSDPKIHTFDGGGKAAQFRLATTQRGFESKDGKKISDVTDWHNCVIKQSGLAGIAEKYIKKGVQVLVEGKVRYRERENDKGEKQYFTEIVVESLEMLDKKPQKDDNDDYIF